MAKICPGVYPDIVQRALEVSGYHYLKGLYMKRPVYPRKLGSWGEGWILLTVL